jgi:lipopolysaccharide transport system ATP-binding protein
VNITGAVSGLIDLGAGFHGDLTGRENLGLGGVIGGLTRAEVAKRLDEIIDFAELSPVIDLPLRFYSTGMTMRLAFSLAIHLPAEVLVVDEVLAVGDLAFQQKCLRRIERFRAEGGTILLVSHDASLVGTFCDRALWLRQGRVVQNGPAQAVATSYARAMRIETLDRTPADAPVLTIRPGIELGPRRNRFGTFEVEITDVRASCQNGTSVDAAEFVRVEMKYRAHVRLSSAIFGVTIAHPDGRTCFETSTDRSGVELPVLWGEGTIGVEIVGGEVDRGSYLVSVGVYERDWQYAYDYHWQAYELTVERGRGPTNRPTSKTRWFVTTA